MKESILQQCDALGLPVLICRFQYSADFEPIYSLLYAVFVVFIFIPYILRIIRFICLNKCIKGNNTILELLLWPCLNFDRLTCRKKKRIVKRTNSRFTFDNARHQDYNRSHTNKVLPICSHTDGDRLERVSNKIEFEQFRAIPGEDNLANRFYLSPDIQSSNSPEISLNNDNTEGKRLDTVHQHMLNSFRSHIGSIHDKQPNNSQMKSSQNSHVDLTALKTQHGQKSPDERKRSSEDSSDYDNDVLSIPNNPNFLEPANATSKLMTGNNQQVSFGNADDNESSGFKRMTTTKKMSMNGGRNSIVKNQLLSQEKTNEKSSGGNILAKIGIRMYNKQKLFNYCKDLEKK